MVGVRLLPLPQHLIHLSSQFAAPKPNLPILGSYDICQVIASAAAANSLPFEFFARVIWQESRFRSDAVGPITRRGQRAQGIAQFMPMTAAESTRSV
jgi:soluble lytic murein transglycosylase-like protein